MAGKEVVPAKLDTVPHMLNSIAGKLSNEPNIQQEILALARKWKRIKEDMIIILNNEGNRVSKRKKRLFSKIRPNETQVSKLKTSVVEFRVKLDIWVDTVRIAQGSNHAVVTKCISRKHECDKDIKMITIDIGETNMQISSLQLEVNVCDNRADACVANAIRLECTANEKHSNAKTHLAALGIGGGLALLGGALFAPFTGGVSLAVATGTAVGNTVVQGTAAIVNECSADNDEIRAKKEWMEADRLRQRISDHYQTLRKKEDDVDKLKKSESELEETCAVLKEVESYILTLIDTVEERLCNIQDTEMLLQQAIDNGDALSIILRALESKKKKGFFRKLFRRKPKYLDSKAEDLMLKIQEKWDEIEKSILPHGKVQEIQTEHTSLQLL